MTERARVVANSLPNNLIAWEALNGECGAIRSALVNEWERLLDDNTLTERDYLAFLRDNAGMFLTDGGRRLVVISELELGAELRPDFVTGTDRSTAGFAYNFIEFQSPHDSAYTSSKKQPSEKLTEAVTQIGKWQIWLASNSEEARRLFPSREFVVTGTPSFHYSVIIGRRDDSDACLHLRNHYAKELGITIRSYDHLTEELRERLFPSIPINYSMEMHQLSVAVRNKLANPFTKAFSSSSWRTFVHAPQISYKHMIAENADLLLDSWDYNDKQKDFIRCWNSIDPKRREFYFDRVEAMLKV